MTQQQRVLRPVLARGVRHRWDSVRRQHQLLFPEGMLVLNETGAAIVELCDGRSTEEVRDALAETYADVNVQNDLDEFLHRLFRRGLIRDAGDL